MGESIEEDQRERTIDEILSYDARTPAQKEHHLEIIGNLADALGRSEAYIFENIGRLAVTVDDLFHYRGYVTDQYRRPSDFWAARPNHPSMTKVNAAKQLWLIGRPVIAKLGLDFSDIASRCSIERARAIAKACKAAESCPETLDDPQIANALREEILTIVTLSTQDMRKKHAEEKGAAERVPLILNGEIIGAPGRQFFEIKGPIRMSREQIRAEIDGRLYLLPMIRGVGCVFTDVDNAFAPTKAIGPVYRTHVDIIDALEDFEPVGLREEPVVALSLPLPDIFKAVDYTYPEEEEEDLP